MAAKAPPGLQARRQATTPLLEEAGVPYKIFPVNIGTPFGGVTLTVPNGVHTVMVTGLTPNGGYTVTPSLSWGYAFKH